MQRVLLAILVLKATERKPNTQRYCSRVGRKIRKQVSPFFDFDRGENSAELAKQYDWFVSKWMVLTFLRDIGKHFSVNQMINKKRLNSV